MYSRSIAVVKLPRYDQLLCSIYFYLMIGILRIRKSSGKWFEIYPIGVILLYANMPLRGIEPLRYIL